MTKKKIINYSLSLVLCLFMVLSFSVPCFAAESNPKTVRVAYFDLGNYYRINEDGDLDSYDSSYLKMISEYTGIRFEYVNCKTWDNALKMLENHEVDLVGTMQWNSKREGRYAICRASYGYAVSELAALPGKGYIYEDYSQLAGTTIGCIRHYVIYDYLKDLMKEHDFSAKIKTYKDQKTLDAALESSEIDLVAANSHAMHDDWKIIAKFSYAPYYFASWKGNEQLTEKINDAIIKINIYQKDFDDSLVKEYFSALVNSPYNKQELQCIDKKKKYTIYFDDDTRPLAWYDKGTNTMQGILVDICKTLEQKTGLQFELQPISKKIAGNRETSVGYYTFARELDTAYNGERGKTEAILDESFFFYHKSGKRYNVDPKKAYTVAIPKGRAGYISYLKKTYPGYKIVEYDTPKKCIAHVASGDADLAFLSSYVAEYILSSEDIDDVVSIPTTSSTMEIGLQFSGSDAQTLAEVINKGFHLIDTSELNNIKLKNVSNTKPTATLAYLIKAHPVQTVLIILALLLLLLLAVVLVVYTKIIRKKNQEIIEADRARMEFFSRMSHDMRTPMNGILGMAHLSRNEKNEAVLCHNMDMVEESGNYMLSLINDTLDLQKIETGKMQLAPEIINFRPFMEGIFDMIFATAKQKNITFRTATKGMDFDRFVKVDSVRLKQIFSNLLSNAIKFTPEGGCVEFTAEKLNTCGNVEQDLFQIRDTGIGISGEFIEHGLFSAYSQERDATTRQYGGSGLGLAITKNLVDLMGGKIEVKSTLGEGTTFTVLLSLEIVDEETVLKLRTKEETFVLKAEGRLRGKKILICEDHPLNAEIARKLLERTGCIVVWAEDGVKGLELFLQSEPGSFDAILMDIRMPKMDGLAAAKAIRTLDRDDAGTVPIIAMTANAYTADIKQSLDVGMNAHLAKPVEPKLLYQTILEQMQ